VSESEGDEQSLYVLLAATGMRISEALALESKHFVNNCRTIQVCQQVDRDHPRIVNYVKTDAGFREVELCTAVGEYLQAFINRKDRLLFETRNGTPYLHNNLEQRWLTPRLEAMGIDERGMGFHAFRRFRKTWLRGKRVQEDINNLWMGHAPETMSETYSRLDLDSTFVSQKRSQWASVSPFRSFQLLQVAPRFRKNRMSTWFCKSSRIR
jgi:integrase